MSVYYQNKKFTDSIDIGYGYTTQTNLTDEIDKIWERLNKTVSLIHNCQNCGARLDIEENHPIFHCKYCGSTYIIGSVQPNSTY